MVMVRLPRPLLSCWHVGLGGQRQLPHNRVPSHSHRRSQTRNPLVPCLFLSSLPPLSIFLLNASVLLGHASSKLFLPRRHALDAAPANPSRQWRGAIRRGAAAEQIWGERTRGSQKEDWKWREIVTCEGELPWEEVVLQPSRSRRRLLLSSNLWWLLHPGKKERASSKRKREGAAFFVYSFFFFWG